MIAACDADRSKYAPSMISVIKPQTTNLGVRSSNLFGRAISPMFSEELGHRTACHAERKNLHGVCMAARKFVAIRRISPALKQNWPFRFGQETLHKALCGSVFNHL